MAYHQDGIQAAIGPCVKICHNQCILSPDRSVANYGKGKVTTEELFETVDGWMANFEVNMNDHDSADKNLSSGVDTYPLNQGQISAFTEEVLKLSLEKSRLTAWDLYNVATEIYKPGKTDFPSLIPQNGAMAELLLSGIPENVEFEEVIPLN